MEPTRDEAGTDRDRLAVVTEKKGGPGVPESGRADEEASPTAEEEPLKAAGRTGAGEGPDAVGDSPRAAGRTGGFPEIAAGWAQTLGAITEEIPIVVIEEDGEEEAPRADDEPAEDPEAAEEPEADEEDSRDAGGDTVAEDPEEAGGDAVEGSSHALEEAGEEPRAIEESEVPRNAPASAQEAPRAADAPVEEAAAEDVGGVPDTTEESPVVVEAASPAEASEAAEGPSDGLEEPDDEPAEEIPQTDEPEEEPEAGGDVAEGPCEGREEAVEAASPTSPAEASEAAEGPSDGLEEPAEASEDSEDAVERQSDDLKDSDERTSPADEGSRAVEEPAGDLRGTGPAQEISKAGGAAGEEAPEADGPTGEPAEAEEAPDVTTLRAAETPDAAPVALPAAKADLPPSYPPPRGARRTRAGAGSPRRRRWIPHRSTILVVVIVIALTALFKTFVIQWFEIPSGSMENTLKVGDGVAVTMYDAKDLERGDVVVFTDPDNWLNVEDPTGLRGVIRDTLVLIHLLPENTGHYLIKRVIGVAGDHVVADGRGSLTVNGAPLDETYLKIGTSPSEVAFDVVVPEGFVWVMGDNRSNSADSRYHQGDSHGGFVPIDDVAGVAKVVVWPISHWRGLGGGHEAFDDVPEPGRAPAPAAPAPENGA